MPFVFLLGLYVLVGYILGGLVIFLIPLAFIAIIFWLIGKHFLTPGLRVYFTRRKERKKLKKNFGRKA